MLVYTTITQKAQGSDCLQWSLVREVEEQKRQYGGGGSRFSWGSPGSPPGQSPSTDQQVQHGSQQTQADIETGQHEKKLYSAFLKFILVISEQFQYKNQAKPFSLLSTPFPLHSSYPSGWPVTKGLGARKAQYHGVHKPESSPHCQRQPRHAEKLLSLCLPSSRTDEADCGTARFPVHLL